MNQRLQRLKNAKPNDVKKFVLVVLCQQERHGCTQHTLTKKICQLKKVSSLRGQPRKDFDGKVNKAIGALQRTKPPQVERPNPKSKWIRLTPHGIKEACK